MHSSTFQDYQTLDVVVVGSCNIDFISYVPVLPMKGQTIHGTSFKTGFGGKGANQCVAAKKLGASCAIVAKVGHDSHGDGFINELQKFGVNTEFITRSEAATGVASCFVDKDGDSSIVIVSGANLTLSSDDVKDAAKVITQAKVLICQLEIEDATTLEALKLGKQLGVRTIFNPAPRKPDLNKEIFKYCDIFCPNETEVSDIPVKTPEEAGRAAITYLDKGCGAVIVTLGNLGCVYVSAKDRKPIHLPCPPVNAIDATGAGDCFVGALAYFMTHFSQLGDVEKLTRAMEVASWSVQHHGTQTSYPLASQLPQSLFSTQ